LLGLTLTFNNESDSEAEVYIRSNFISKVLNNCISQIKIPDKKIPNSLYLINDGFNFGYLRLEAVTISFTLRESAISDVNNPSYASNYLFRMHLQDLVSANGKYVIEFPFFVEKGEFSINFPSNIVNFYVQIDKESDPTLKYILTYNTFIFFSFPIEFTSKGYYFNKFYKKYRNDFYNFAKGHIELHVANSLPSLIQDKPQNYLNSYLTKTVDIGKFRINYILWNDLMFIDFNDFSYYAFTIHRGCVEVLPTYYPRRLDFYPPKIGNGEIVFSFSYDFIDSVFYHLSRNDSLNYTIDKTQAKEEQKIHFSTMNFKDNIPGLLDKFGNTRVQLILQFDWIKKRNYLEGISRKCFRYSFEFQVFDNSKNLYVDSVIGVCKLCIDFTFIINPNFSITPQLNSASLNDFIIDQKSPFTPIDLSVFEVLLQNMIVVGVSYVNTNLLSKNEFKVFDFDDALVDTAYFDSQNIKYTIHLK